MPLVDLGREVCGVIKTQLEDLYIILGAVTHISAEGESDDGLGLESWIYLKSPYPES